MATGGLNLSKEFFELLKAIGESKSKQEEDRIIAKEVTRLKHKMEAPANSYSTAAGGTSSTSLLHSSKKHAKEFLVRLLYVEMLGHDASFGYIKAVEMTASASLPHKRTGYTVCAACLPPDHEFRFMLVNQMQRDLQSANVLECAGGLIAITTIITADMVPAVGGEVVKLLVHDSATVRKKTVVCMHRLFQLAPEVITREEVQDALRKAVCDKDPSVMGASLNVMEALAVIDPQPFKDLVPSLVSILKQIGEHRLPADYDYHRVPAPWIQMKLVRILSLLGKTDAAASSGMYEIVADTMKKADTGINAGYAIVYECIKCVVTIYPNPALLDAAADAISRFIQSRSHNLKYLGVTGLAMIVESHPQYAAQHQLAVMDCLEDPDETLQRKTLDLLYRMTNPVNVEFITAKLVDFISGTTDQFLKQMLTLRVCSVAERYAPNNAWYIRTMTALLKVSGDMVPASVAQNLMSLIAEGTGESDQADIQLRQSALEIYVDLLQEKPLASLPRILLETMAWCLGEYAYLSQTVSLDYVLTQLCVLARTHKTKLAATTRKFVVTAIMKLVAQAGTCPPHAATVIADFTRSTDVDLQQRCLEFQNCLTACPHLLPQVLPVDASAEDLDVDANLSFLDNYVRQALANGVSPYEKPDDDDEEDDAGAYLNGGAYGAGLTESAFNLTPYEKPPTPAQSMMSMAGLGSGSRPSAMQSSVPLPPGSHMAVTDTPRAQAGDVGGVTPLALNTRNVANVWGRGGLNTGPVAAQPTPSVGAPVPAPVPANPAWGETPGYGGSSAAPATPPATVEPVKTAAQLEKERLAAGLFGGIVPGAVPPPAPSSYGMTAPVVVPPVFPAPPPKASALVVSAPVAPPVPAPEVDLLDMGLWDAPAAAAPGAVSLSVFDSAPPFVATALPTTAAPSAMVETVSDDEDDLTQMAPAAPAPCSVDPFAGAGLLDDVQDTPLQSFPSLSLSAKVPLAAFEFQNRAMSPLKIATAQFGQQWGSCPATSNISVASSRKIAHLQDWMQLCQAAGMHPVEAIVATSEGICAGMITGSNAFCLVHAKITPGGGASHVQATIKSTDAMLAGNFATYLQSMLQS